MPIALLAVFMSTPVLDLRAVEQRGSFPYNPPSFSVTAHPRRTSQ